MSVLKYFTKSWWTTPQTRLEVRIRFKGDQQAGFPEYFPQERIPLLTFNWSYIPWENIEGTVCLNNWVGQVSTESEAEAKEVIDKWLRKYYIRQEERKVTINRSYIKYP